MITCIFDESLKIPKYEQLYRLIREKIEEGTIAPDEKLPSKRKLSQHLQISTITVETAYNQLVAEGYAVSVPKSGYYVQTFDKSAINKADYFYGSFPKEDETRHYKFDFKTNQVDTKLFPYTTWAKTARNVLNYKSTELLNKTHPQGLYELRCEIASHLYKFRGMNTNPDQIIISAGSEYLIDLIVKILGRKKVYAIENPGYKKVFNTLIKNDVKIIPLSIDENGASMNDLRNSCADIIHITPSHQFPTGIVMPMKRRTELLNWANESSGRYIIEDDYDSEFRFQGSPISSLHRLAGSGKVIYMNTFTRSIAPSFRVGYMVLPENLLKIYKNSFMYISCPVPNLEQYMLFDFMQSGMFERHLLKMKKVYKERRDAFIDSVANESLSSYTKIFGHDFGLHLLMNVFGNMDESSLINLAEKFDVRVYGISDYYNFSSSKIPKNTLVIGYSGLDVNQIKEGVKNLSLAWRKSSTDFNRLKCF